MSAPAFDPTALANSVEESAAPIERKREHRKYDVNPFVDKVQQTIDKRGPYAVTVPANQVRTLLGYLRDAAAKANAGLRVEFVMGKGKNEKRYGSVSDVPKDENNTTPVLVRFQGLPDRKQRATTECPVCHKTVTVTADNKVRKHGKRNEDPCAGSETSVSA